MTITVSGSSITFPDATTQTTAATANPIPTGTVVLFYQAAAPTGWTQVTTLDDYGLRLVSGTGGATAGTTAFSTVFTNQSPTTGATTLSTAQIPSHTHNIYYASAGSKGVPQPPLLTFYTNGPPTSSTPSLSTGGGGSHTHPGGTVTLNLRYANIIICSKN